MKSRGEQQLLFRKDNYTDHKPCKCFYVTFYAALNCAASQTAKQTVTRQNQSMHSRAQSIIEFQVKHLEQK